MPVGSFEEFYNLCWKVKMVVKCRWLWLIAIAAACWTICLSRNAKVFENKLSTMESLKVCYGYEPPVMNVCYKNNYGGAVQLNVS